MNDDDELRTLQNDIKHIDQASGPPPDPDAPVPVSLESAAEAWAEIPDAVGMLLTTYLPELQPVYARDACLNWGKAMAKLAEKRGWSGGGLPPEVTVLMATAGFVVPTVGAIKRRRAAAAEQKPGDTDGHPK